MATKTHPYTAKLSYSTDNTTYTDLADIVSIKPPNLSKGDTDTTVLSSTGEAKEFIPGWRDSGEVGTTLAFVNSVYVTLLGFYQSNTLYYWKWTAPTISSETVAAKLVSYGYVKTLELSEMKAGQDEMIQMPVTIKNTGVVTYTTSS